jgi:hypothetical protein
VRMRRLPKFRQLATGHGRPAARARESVTTMRSHPTATQHRIHSIAGRDREHQPPISHAPRLPQLRPARSPPRASGGSRLGSSDVHPVHCCLRLSPGEAASLGIMEVALMTEMNVRRGRHRGHECWSGNARFGWPGRAVGHPAWWIGRRPAGCSWPVRAGCCNSLTSGELTEHLGHDKHDPAGRNGGNSRNEDGAHPCRTGPAGGAA